MQQCVVKYIYDAFAVTTCIPAWQMVTHVFQSGDMYTSAKADHTLGLIYTYTVYRSTLLLPRYTVHCIYYKCTLYSVHGIATVISNYITSYNNT